MMKKLLGIICLCLLVTGLQAQVIEEVSEEEIMEEEEPVFIDQSIEEEPPRPTSTYYTSKYQTQRIDDTYQWYYLKNNSSYTYKYGLLKNGEPILPMVFTRANQYSNDSHFFVLGIGNNYGLFDLHNEKWSIPVQYEQLTFLNKGLYVASHAGGVGIVDNHNNTVVEFEWSSIQRLQDLENYVMVSTPSSQGGSKKGVYSITARKLVVPCKYIQITKMNSVDYFHVKEGKKHNIISIHNEPRFKHWYDELHIPSMARKLYIVKKDGKMGVVNESEKVVVPIEYMEISSQPYRDGSHLARNSKGKYGCMTLDGKETLPFEYDNITLQNYTNTAITMKNDKCGIVQVNDGVPFEIATCDYDGITKSQKGFIIEKGGKYGLMDLYGKETLPIEYSSIKLVNAGSGSSNLYIAIKKGKWFLFNSSGKQVTQDSYSEIKIIPSKNGQRTYSYHAPKYSYLKAKKSNGKYIVIDKVGTLIDIPEFEEISGETKNLLMVKNNGKYGLYSILLNKQVLPFEYDQIIVAATDKSYGMIGNDFYELITRGGTMTAKKVK